MGVSRGYFSLNKGKKWTKKEKHAQQSHQNQTCGGSAGNGQLPIYVQSGALTEDRLRVRTVRIGAHFDFL